MTQRLLQIAVLSILTCALVLGGGATGPGVVHSDVLASLMARLGTGPSEASAQPELVSTIVFTSSRSDPAANTFDEFLLALEIYLMNPEPSNPDPTRQNVRRLTENTDVRDLFPALSPNGRLVVFDSNRLRTPSQNINTSDLFVMNTDGKGQRHVGRGSVASWSPDSRMIAYHASATDRDTITPQLSSPTFDSDIFVANVNNVLDGTGSRTNITDNGGTFIEEDPDWSPDGQWIAYTRYTVADPSYPPHDCPTTTPPTPRTPPARLIY